MKNRVKQFVIDGEAVILAVDGVADFDALHSGKHNDEVQLYAFDMLASDCRDRPYQAGRSKHWIKLKNRKHPAMSRVIEAFA